MSGCLVGLVARPWPAPGSEQARGELAAAGSPAPDRYGWPSLGEGDRVADRLRWHNTLGVRRTSPASRARLIPGPRILVAECPTFYRNDKSTDPRNTEFQGRVTERDLTGKICWEYSGVRDPVNFRRLANGDTLVAGQLMSGGQVTHDGKLVYELHQFAKGNGDALPNHPRFAEDGGYFPHPRTKPLARCACWNSVRASERNALGCYPNTSSRFPASVSNQPGPPAIWLPEQTPGKSSNWSQGLNVIAGCAGRPLCPTPRMRHASLAGKPRFHARGA